eukprot:scaffold1093_cov226-Chaetoceros_neogracile.AAC.2
MGGLGLMADSNMYNSSIVLIIIIIIIIFISKMLKFIVDEPSLPLLSSALSAGGDGRLNYQ